MIPAEAVEAAAKAFIEHGTLLEALEAAAPHMLSHEREQARLAHLDAMVNRETKQSELAAAWDDGHLMGWNEATANTMPERDSLWRNPYRKRGTDAV